MNEAAMKSFHYAVRNDYDQKVRMKNEDVLCYSKKRLATARPELDPNTLHEARVYSEGEKKPNKDTGVSKYQQETVGEMPLGAEKLGVANAGTNNRFLYKKAGYVCMNDNTCVALCTSRIPFLLAMLGILAAIVVAILLILSLLTGDRRPVINPDNPLPPLEENMVPDTEQGVKEESPEGGGSVSMIYTLSATVDLSTKDVKIHFRNPVMSNHSVSVEFYIVSGGEEYLAAKSGLIPAGNGLFLLTLDDDAPQLSEGVYEGLYRVLYYDPETGVRAHVQSDITGVSVSVYP